MLQRLRLDEQWLEQAKIKLNSWVAALDGDDRIVALLDEDNTFTGANNFTGALQLAGVSLLAGLRGHIAGLTCSNNGSDPTNDIDVAAGSAVAADQSALLVLGSALTKRLDASWVVGTNQGGLDTGSIANTTYHVWLIRRPDTGVVDALFSASATAPTMPTNYTQKRRIGSFLREAGTIVAFKQTGDVFKIIIGAADRSNTAAAAAGLLAVRVPLGIVVGPLLVARLSVGASVTCLIQLGAAAAGAIEVTVLNALTGAGDSSDFSISTPPPIFFTDTSAQIYFAQINTAGTPTASELFTYGWVDTRGQDD